MSIGCIVKDFEEQLMRGLQTDNDSSLRMLPTWITSLPTGDESGEFYALDIGGTNLRVIRCMLGNDRNQVTEHESKEIEIPNNRKFGKVHNLFDFVAASFKICLQLAGRDVEKEKYSVGFCFSFPLKMQSVDSGLFDEMTKGYNYEDARGKDAVQLLKNACGKQGLNVEVHVVCNDAVGVLAAGRYTNPKTQIGVVLATGTNASCVQTVGSISKWTPGLPKDLTTAVNIEWGAFNSEFLPMLDLDRQLDIDSSHPGQYLFEKKISGYYIGEVCRMVLVSMCREGALFKDVHMGDLHKPNAFTSEMVSDICSDASARLENSAAMLKTKLKVSTNQKAMDAIRKVCEMVTDRATTLVGCSLAATIMHVHKGTPELVDPVVVAVDGAVYIKFERFRKLMDTKTKSILQLVYGDGHPKFELLPYLGGSCYGAAMLAAAI